MAHAHVPQEALFCLGAGTFFGNLASNFAGLGLASVPCPWNWACAFPHTCLDEEVQSPSSTLGMAPRLCVPTYRIARTLLHTLPHCSTHRYTAYQVAAQTRISRNIFRYLAGGAGASAISRDLGGVGAMRRRMKIRAIFLSDRPFKVAERPYQNCPPTLHSPQLRQHPTFQPCQRPRLHGSTPPLVAEQPPKHASMG